MIYPSSRESCTGLHPQKYFKKPVVYEFCGWSTQSLILSQMFAVSVFSFKTRDLKIALVVADVLDPTKSKNLSHLGNNKKNALDLGRGFIRLFLFSSTFSVLSKK